MKRTAPCYEVAKSQRVRVLDVVLLGPGTIAAGAGRIGGGGAARRVGERRGEAGRAERRSTWSIALWTTAAPRRFDASEPEVYLDFVGEEAL